MHKIMYIKRNSSSFLPQSITIQMTKTLRIAKNFLAQFAIVALILEQFLFVFASSAHAADLPITPDGSTNTQIDAAANNVPIVKDCATKSCVPPKYFIILTPQTSRRTIG
jgi:hypothetical protein